MNREIVVAAVAIVLVYYVMTATKRRCGHQQVAEPLDQTYPLTGGLYPLRHPLFCAREAAKHCALLEDHLSDPHRRCQECCKKHMLMLEGFLEEGMLMDRHQKYHDVLIPALAETRNTVKRYVQGQEPMVLAQCFREIRKPLAAAGFEYFA